GAWQREAAAEQNRSGKVHEDDHGGIRVEVHPEGVGPVWLAEHGSGLYARRDYASLLIYPRLATPQMRVEIRATACLPEPTHPTPQEGS
ncbi:hypothetical protein ACIRL3_12170, partial [Streptomyces sp. NPDC102384]|uniref:hypothetical protein n=1 Tax=Streptomyces sp. NPDC102384 TaxID=3366166 RepID=UPI00380F834B